MGKIIVLDENTSNKIAAGEVIERPASVVKELIENSIDAGATSISVEIKNGGISYIKVTDNGTGIDEDDIEIAFERHATSKIRNADDLESIDTLGFRGEALASIASVSTVELTSRVALKPHGNLIKVQAGRVKDVRQTGCPVGTTFVIKDLFYNTPARFKFLKKDATEAGYISDIMNRVALSKPQIALKLISNNVSIVHTPGNNDLLSVIFSIYGRETAKEVVEINYEDSKIKITGFAGKAEIARANRNQQSIFVNGRYIKSKVITSAVDEAYKTFLMKNKYPFMVLNIVVNPLLIDVNVHPTKMEIRFSEEQEVFRSIYHAISNALLGKNLIKSVQLEEKDRNAFKFEPQEENKTKYTQQNIELNSSSIRESLANHIIQKQKLNETTPEYKKDIIIEQTKPIHVKLEEVIEDTKLVFKEIIKQTNFQLTEFEKKEIPVEAKAEVCIENSVEDIFKHAIIIGQAFSTYILLQNETNLIMIDQHAAHERIMYEALKKKISQQESLSQNLLSPIVIEMTNQEVKLLEEEKDFFNKLGFKYEDFGNNAIILRSVPFGGMDESIKSTFLEIVDNLMSKGKHDFKKITDDTLYTIACKAAIKANKHLDELEIKSILKDLSKLENPYTCPHGRPTIIKLTKYELEKMFKRIV